MNAVLCTQQLDKGTISSANQTENVAFHGLQWETIKSDISLILNSTLVLHGIISAKSVSHY